MPKIGNIYNLKVQITPPVSEFFEVIEELARRGAMDCTYSVIDGIHELEFDRFGLTEGQAVESIERDILNACQGSTIVKIYK